VGRRREPRRPELAASYRKVFPWRPYERWGGSFVVADMAGFGRVGLSICYDSWFPEVARHLAWMGAEVILNPTLTPTADRAQELVLARAQAITNQVYVVGVNAAAPTARGRSLLVDPKGNRPCGGG
jgi:predicted amidohydrolase